MAKKEKKAKKSKAEKKEKKKSRRERKEEQKSRIPKTAYDTVLSTLGGFVCFTAVMSVIVLLLIVAYAVIVSL